MLGATGVRRVDPDSKRWRQLLAIDFVAIGGPGCLSAPCRSGQRELEHVVDVAVPSEHPDDQETGHDAPEHRVVRWYR
jgi:hypothetical protein